MKKNVCILVVVMIYLGAILVSCKSTTNVPSAITINIDETFISVSPHKLKTESIESLVKEKSCKAKSSWWTAFSFSIPDCTSIEIYDYIEASDNSLMVLT